jgi:hypothetical protein
MKKPSLRITKWLGDIPIEGECTSCPEIGKFGVRSTRPNKAEHQKQLQQAFDSHFKEVHLREDASHAAARIVVEATENH